MKKNVLWSQSNTDVVDGDKEDDVPKPKRPSPHYNTVLLLLYQVVIMARVVCLFHMLSIQSDHNSSAPHHSLWNVQTESVDPRTTLNGGVV